MLGKNEAYLNFWGGIYYVNKYPSQERICYSKDFSRATRKARKLGYNVRVYCGSSSGGTDSYVLKAIKS